MSRRLLLAVPTLLALIFIAGISGPTTVQPLNSTRTAQHSTATQAVASHTATAGSASTAAPANLALMKSPLPGAQAAPSLSAASPHPPFPPPPVPPPPPKPVRALIWVCPPLLPVSSPLQPVRHSVCGDGFHAGETVVIRITSPRGLYWWTTVATPSGSIVSPLPFAVCRYLPGTLRAYGARGSVSNALPLITGCLAA